MTVDHPLSRLEFARGLANAAVADQKLLILGALGAGKTHSLLQVRDVLDTAGVACAFVDLFTAASTPERLIAALGDAVIPFMPARETEIRSLIADCVEDRHNASRCLLKLFDLLATTPASRPFVWLVDEVTEIRSLAYFPDLSAVEVPFARALSSARGAILTSSYLGLATDLFPDFEARALPTMTPLDLQERSSLRADGPGVALAIALTNGSAATLLPLFSDMQDSRDLTRSLVTLLAPGRTLESVCRRHYEVLLLRSRGYAVCKRTAEVVAGRRNQRLTDLFPLIGRTAGASRQYLRWLVEVGLLVQVQKKYDFADPVLGLWASLYLGRGGHPDREFILHSVSGAVEALTSSMTAMAPALAPTHDPATSVPAAKRADRFEEID